MTLPRCSALAALLAGCSTDAMFAGDATYTDAPSTASSTPDGDTGTPGEEEDDLLRLPPAQTDVYVFIANPDRDTVTRVEVRSLSVDTTPVGHDPRLVATTSDRRRAVVFNRGDHSVSILDAATLRQEVVEVRENLNDLVLSPDGAWAVLWHNAARVRPDDPPPQGVESFNEASFVNLRDAAHQPLAVGFDPQMVRFTPDGSLAVIVSDSALALIDLTQDTLEPEMIELQPMTLDPASAEEVVLAPDGSYAWVRLFGSPDLRVVDLSSHVVSTVAAGTDPTDLDLSPDGAETVVVSRDSHELFVFETAHPFRAGRTIPLPAGSTYGSLTWNPTGRDAILYTNAAREERYALWDPSDDTVWERPLVKPVQSVAVSPDGGTLLVFHTEADGPATNPLFLGEEALTLIDLDDYRSNPMLLPGPPLAYANAASGEAGYLVMEGERALEVLDYDSLLHHPVPLSSPPVFLGVLPDLTVGDADEPQAWVSQEYSLGRITFFDPDDESVETLTGFELNAGIESGR